MHKNGQRLLAKIPCTYWTMYVLNVGLQWSCFAKESYLFAEHIYIDHCTYFSFGLLEAPRENILHGPLLGIYWLWLCFHSGAPTLEATLLQRGLFIVLMTAAHISPMSFPSNCPLLAYWASYFGTIRHTYTWYITFTFTHLILCYNILNNGHSSILRLHFSTLRGRLAALDLLCPIQEQILIVQRVLDSGEGKLEAS